MAKGAFRPHTFSAFHCRRTEYPTASYGGDNGYECAHGFGVLVHGTGVYFQLSSSASMGFTRRLQQQWVHQGDITPGHQVATLKIENAQQVPPIRWHVVVSLDS